MVTVTKAAVKFDPRGNVHVPFCGYESDVLCFDWWNQLMFYHGVRVYVSNKDLKINNINVDE